MFEPEKRANRLVVMLTADRQIDRRITLEADVLESAGWQVVIIGMPLDSGYDHDKRTVRVQDRAGAVNRENLVLATYRRIRRFFPMNGIVMRWLKKLTWRYFIDQESFFTRLFLPTALRYSPRVFVAHDLPMLPVAVKAARACGSRFVYDSHELYSEQEFSDWEKRRWASIEKRYIGESDLVITVNQSIATELEKRYQINDVKVIYNAVMTTQAPTVSRRLHEIFGLSADKKIVLLQGGLSAGRHLEVLVDSIKYVKNLSLVLVLLGDGMLLSSLKKRVQKMGLGCRVYFHPAVPQSDLLKLTAAADAGVIPYQPTCLNNLYCTPNKLFEFIAAGIPILATDLPEIRRIVHDKNIGMVGDTSSSQKLAKLLEEFFSNEQRLSKWRQKLAEVRQEVCWEHEGRKLIESYEVLR